MSYRGLIDNLSDNQVFVFGSNPIGINGAGSALWAVKNAGVRRDEKMDNRLSDSGKAYGLVTVTAPGKKRSIKPEQIINNIKKLYNFAKKNKDLHFLIGYTHSGDKKSLNGYSGKEMASMFILAGKRPDNVFFNVNFNKVTII